MAGEPAEAVAVAQAAVDAPDGIGTITSYATEVALPATGTWKNPGIGSTRADLVLIAPEAGVPLLFIEADNCTEDATIIAAIIAGKFDNYLRFCQRKVKDTDGHEKPMWRTRWAAPETRYGDAPHPPVSVWMTGEHKGRPPGRRCLRREAVGSDMVLPASSSVQHSHALAGAVAAIVEMRLHHLSWLGRRFRGPTEATPAGPTSGMVGEDQAS
ncbi:hypothetical protein OG762_48525 (plasmid) [Streptomyces sp. NBC_01136]|uniref:hypothetical protein n=1 Tax=unclassified Streptomyces TaxID=2593676 RepID=UPI002F918961|nr:hypothetical protein OG762_48525 [Streptomyces sp. NBC_01136]